MKSSVTIPSLLAPGMILLTGSLGLGASPASAQPSRQGTDQTPNLLFIQCDQLRYDALGVNGNRICRTPNIDRLASRGMSFSNAYTPIATSCPARQSLMSGLWPAKHGCLWNYQIAQPVREFDSPTWSEALQKTGVSMNYIGKWHVHPTRTPLEFGYDEFVEENYVAIPGVSVFDRGPENRGQSVWALRPGEDVYYHDQSVFLMGGYYTNKTKEQSHVYGYVVAALEMIEKCEREGRTWHLNLEFEEPHLPCMPLREFYDMYKDVEIPMWGNFNDTFEGKPLIQEQQVLNWSLENKTWEDWQNYVRSYYALITQVDDAVGCLLDELERRGYLRNTVVVFTADHGDASGCHKMIDKHYVGYEEEVHVPLIIRWDGVVEPGSVCDEFLAHEIDLAETITDLYNLDFETQGSSLLPLLRGEKVEGWRQYAFSEHNGQQYGLYNLRMIKDRRYKYVWNATDVDEFYDLELDPYEMHNAIGDPGYAPEIERLRKALYDEMVSHGDQLTQGAGRQLLQGKTAVRR